LAEPKTKCRRIAYKAFIKAISVKAKISGLLPACLDKNSLRAGRTVGAVRYENQLKKNSPNFGVRNSSAAG
jgi:hypothetical protein